MIWEMFVENDAIMFKNIILAKLPSSINVKYSLDFSDSDITELSEELFTAGDLIIGNAKIDKLPNKLMIGGNLIMTENILPVPNTAVIAGKIITKDGEYYPSVPRDHYIETDDGNKVIFNKPQKLENNVHNDEENYYKNEIYFYKSIDKHSLVHAVSCVINNKQYVLSCLSNKDGYYKIRRLQAILKGANKYFTYDIKQPRTVSELKEIYKTCTGACDSGIDIFINTQVDKNRLYSIQDLAELLKKYNNVPETDRKIFLEFFAR